ncbi:cytochrome P450 hydroxylase [Streptomyces fuscichromogenes]|uniref:Cytochrome P450 hydroxylase n=2 Tax=Streptomyces fuscichromogenes TaxID=1324013 RepID=A0A917XLY4_9ACTN|nr:cytochrome P450 hydroxylase [Streptomyces fuscichromogenes]
MTETRHDHFPIFDLESIADERNKNLPPRQVMMNGAPVWLVARYEEVRECLAHSALSPAPAYAAEHGQESPLSGLFIDTVFGNNPPEHTRLRRMLTKEFNAARVESLRPRVQEILDGLLDEIAPDGHADLVTSLSIPLPTLVICDLLGIPAADRHEFHQWAQAMIASGFDESAIAASRVAAQQLWDYIEQLTERKRHAPEGDLISDLVSANAEDRLSQRELVATARVLLVAGYELTSGMLSNAVFALLTHPQQQELLRRDPDLVVRSIDELLRYDGPGIFNVRFANEDVRIGPALIRAGEQVLMDLQAASRDPALYVDAERLDLTRNATAHLQFGHGIHYCVGAPLARLEGQLVITTLLRRFPDLRLGCPVEQVSRTKNNFLSSLAGLPVQWTPSSQPGNAHD